MNNYDVVVIGAGPGGYIAAIRCAQLGLDTACIESRVNQDNKPCLGGTCLNVGCIPSKALLDSSHHYSYIKNDASKHGINVSNVTLDLEKMLHRKGSIVDTLVQGIAGLFKKHKIKWLKGHASLLENKQIAIHPTQESHDEKTIITAKHIIIATGSMPAEIPVATVDQQNIVDSTAALAFDDVPHKLGIIGAGAIGLELGSIWQRLGAEVTILEALPDLLPSVDRQIAIEVHKILRGQGLNICLGAKVTTTGTGNNCQQVTVHYDGKEGKEQLLVDKLIIAVGRKPNTQGLGADTCGLELDQSGFIVVDEKCHTNLEGVYAIGDVVRGPMLAHKASKEGVSIAEHIAGLPASVNLELIPSVIYTWPEVAWVGKTEQTLDQHQTAYRKGIFPFMASGRSRASGEIAGMVKILADKRTDRLLGVHIVGANASELINEAVLAMEFDGSAEDLARTIHAHPTLSEAMHEAALAVDQRPLHI